MGHNNQKKIAAINDYTGFGRCSIAVELPVISALKVQCCPLPTSVLSNHTGFDSFYFEDFTDSMPAYIAEWKKLNLKFDGICSGFLGSHRQIKIVEDFFKTFKTDENIILVDPVTQKRCFLQQEPSLQLSPLPAFITLSLPESY